MSVDQDDEPPVGQTWPPNRSTTLSPYCGVVASRSEEAPCRGLGVVVSVGVCLKIGVGVGVLVMVIVTVKVLAMVAVSVVVSVGVTGDVVVTPKGCV